MKDLSPQDLGRKKKLADGELSQVTTSPIDCQPADLVLPTVRFMTKNRHVFPKETSHHVELPIDSARAGLPEPLVISLNGETGQYQVRQREKTADEKLISGPGPSEGCTTA